MFYLEPVIVTDMVPTKQATTIISRSLSRVQSMNQKQNQFRMQEQKQKHRLERLIFETTSRGMVGPGLAEPSRVSSESEAPPDARDPEVHCPRVLKLEAPLVPVRLESDYKARSREVQSKLHHKCKERYTNSIYST